MLIQHAQLMRHVRLRRVDKGAYEQTQWENNPLEGIFGARDAVQVQVSMLRGSRLPRGRVWSLQSVWGTLFFSGLSEYLRVISGVDVELLKWVENQPLLMTSVLPDWFEQAWGDLSVMDQQARAPTRLNWCVVQVKEKDHSGRLLIGSRVVLPPLLLRRSVWQLKCTETVDESFALSWRLPLIAAEMQLSAQEFSQLESGDVLFPQRWNFSNETRRIKAQLGQMQFLFCSDDLAEWELVEMKKLEEGFEESFGEDFEEDFGEEHGDDGYFEDEYADEAYSDEAYAEQDSGDEAAYEGGEIGREIQDERVAHSALEDQGTVKDTVGAKDLADLPVKLRFELGSLRLSARKLQSLAAGSILSLEQGMPPKVAVIANGLRIGSAELIEVEGVGLAVQVDKIYTQ